MAAIAALALLLTSPVAARDFPGVPLPERLPIVTTWYDPALGGINCAGNCATFGSGMAIQEAHYRTSAACLTEWRGRMVVIPGFGAFVCRDSGGAVTRAWERGVGKVIRVDVLSREPLQRGPWTRWWLE